MITIKNLDRVLKEMSNVVNSKEKEIEQLLNRVARQTLTAIKEDSPVLTGKLKRSMDAKQIDKLSIQISSSVEYSKYVEEHYIADPNKDSFFYENIDRAYDIFLKELRGLFR